MRSFRVEGSAWNPSKGPPPPRPNLIVHRRPAKPGQDAAGVAGDISKSLATSIGQLAGLGITDFEFDDGAKGVLMSYSFPASPTFTVHQFQAVRVDGAIASTLTLSTDMNRTTSLQRDANLKALKSAALTQ